MGKDEVDDEASFQLKLTEITSEMNIITKTAPTFLLAKRS